MMQFVITGGVHTDMSFTEVEPGKEEEYGPFPSYEQAVQVWRGKMGANIDTCEHRLFIRPQNIMVDSHEMMMPLNTSPFSMFGEDAEWLRATAHRDEPHPLA